MVQSANVLEVIVIDKKNCYLIMFLTAKKKHKYFIGHRDDYKIRALYILFPKMRECEKNFARDLHMSFLIDDDKLLEKYNKIWDKVSNSIKNIFDNEPKN